jgi:DNA-binding protein Fis
MIERESLRDRLAALVEEMVDRGILFEDACLQFETRFVHIVLDRHSGNLSKAADELRLHRNTLSKRIKAAEARTVAAKAKSKAKLKAKPSTSRPRTKRARLS